MSNYYIRYRSGDCEAVVRELVNLGKNVTEPSIRVDIEAVARELVDRSLQNLYRLRDRLRDLGYLFEHPEDALVEATADDLSALEAVESGIGVLPIIVRKWYERIKSVDFSQQKTQLFSKDEASCCPVSGLGLHTPLVFLSIPKCLVLQDQLCNQAESFGDDPRKFKNFLPLGGWGSNSNPKGFWLPSESFDAEYYNEGAGGVYFVEELRIAFRWGGFPFWRRLLTDKKRVQPLHCLPSFQTILPILTDGLLRI
jgi:hypothetical protein